ncbi:HEAT repeat domain-containing protein [Limnospira platensis]|uniref:HEAT repeat domain-containing protein n=1 Tax=Limnospira platensis TaxID=118562 RepID=UPI003391BBE6
MDLISLLIMLIIGSLAGLGVSYTVLERRLTQQREEYERQIRLSAEELEKAHQVRIQEMVQSLRDDYDRQLREMTETLKQEQEDELTKSNESLTQYYQSHIEELTNQVQSREEELQEANQQLREYQQELGNLTEELYSRERKVEELNEFLSGYQTQLEEVNQDLQASQTRLHEMGESLTGYETQLHDMDHEISESQDRTQKMEEYIATYDNQLQQLEQDNYTTKEEIRETLKNIQQHSEQEIQKLRADLEQDQETQIQNAIDNLEEQYNDEIRAGTEELVRAMQSQTEQMIKSLHERLEFLPELLAESEAEAATEAATPEETLEETEAVAEVAEVSEEVEESAMADGLMAVGSVKPPLNLKVTGHSRDEKEDLLIAIAKIGESQNLAAIANLVGYTRHADTEIRTQLAATLGRLASTHGLRAEIQQAIPTLTQLSQDSNAQVRQEAIYALGMIKSDRVIPILKQGLRDPDPSVVQAASMAMEKFKFYHETDKQAKPIASVFQKPEDGSKG